MISEKIIFLAILSTFIGSYAYIKDIFAGRTKPNLVSWFFWGLAPLIAGFLQLKADAGLSVIAVFMSGTMPVLVIVTAIMRKNAYWKISTFDILCGVFSFIALISWILTRETGISILFAILADALAYIPTLYKVWKYPETESLGGYIPGIFNHTLALFILREWSFSQYSFSVYLILINIFMIFLMYRRKIFPTKLTEASL